MKNFSKYILYAALSLLPVSCEREDSGVQPDVSTKENAVRMELAFNLSYPGTKSILDTPAVEDRLTNVLVGLYRVKNGLLDKTFSLSADNSEIDMLSGVEYNIYVLANVPESAGFEFPARESDIGSCKFRLPSFASVSQNGIPSCARIPSVISYSSGVRDVTLTRLFAKLTVTIEHEGFSGTGSDCFRDEELHIRAANSVICPFGVSRAERSSDVLALSDYDSDMSSMGTDTYVFYVPENMQGTVSGIVSASDKSETWLASHSIDNSTKTYVEFEAYLDPAAGGFGGSLRYRFYLGGNATDNFDIERNRHYAVSLNFSSESVFNPSWKVDPGDDFADHRFLGLRAKNGMEIPQDYTIALRPGEGTDINLFMNTDGSSVNMVSSSHQWYYASCPEQATAQGMYWASNVASLDGGSLSLPSQLAADGISVSCSAQTGNLHFWISDPSKVKEGKEYQLEFCLFPDRLHHTRRVKLKVMPAYEMSLTGDMSRFFVAQGRSVRVKGAMSSTFTASVESPSIKLLDLSSGTMDIVSGEGSLQFYGIYSGDKLPSGKDYSVLRLTPSDQINDSVLEEKVYVRTPYLKFDTGEGTSSFIASKSLTYDGYEESLGLFWYDSYSSTASRLTEAFVPAYYSSCLKPETVHAKQMGPAGSIENFIGFSEDLDKVYMKALKYGSDDFTTYRHKQDWTGAVIDRITMKPQDKLTGMYGSDQRARLDVTILNPFPTNTWHTDPGVPTITMNKEIHLRWAQAGYESSDRDAVDPFSVRYNAHSIALSTETEGFVPEFADNPVGSDVHQLTIFFPYDRQRQAAYLGRKLYGKSRYVQAEITNVHSGEKVCERYLFNFFIHVTGGAVLDCTFNSTSYVVAAGDMGVKLMWYDQWKLRKDGPIEVFWSNGSDDGIGGNIRDWMTMFYGGNMLDTQTPEEKTWLKLSQLNCSYAYRWDSAEMWSWEDCKTFFHLVSTPAKFYHMKTTRAPMSYDGRYGGYQKSYDSSSEDYYVVFHDTPASWNGGWIGANAPDSAGGAPHWHCGAE